LPPGPDRKALLASLHTFLDSVEDEVTIEVRLLHGGAFQVTLPAAPPPVRHDASTCRQDIISVLRSAGHRLTTSQILNALDKRYMTWGESTVKAKLAEMVRDGTLTNDPNARPQGYGLPEWSGGSGNQQTGATPDSTAENI